jgi:hypothetical protein
VQDLQKSLHYIRKADERNVRPDPKEHRGYENIHRFIKQFDRPDRDALLAMLEGRYVVATLIIQTLIADTTS